MLGGASTKERTSNEQFMASEVAKVGCSEATNAPAILEPDGLRNDGGLAQEVNSLQATVLGAAGVKVFERL